MFSLFVITYVHGCTYNKVNTTNTRKIIDTDGHNLTHENGEEMYEIKNDKLQLVFTLEEELKETETEVISMEIKSYCLINIWWWK